MVSDLQDSYGFAMAVRLAWPVQWDTVTEGTYSQLPGDIPI